MGVLGLLCNLRVVGFKSRLFSALGIVEKLAFLFICQLFLVRNLLKIFVFNFSFSRGGGGFDVLLCHYLFLPHFLLI